jgi:hypothetical protein
VLLDDNRGVVVVVVLEETHDVKEAANIGGSALEAAYVSLHDSEE